MVFDSHENAGSAEPPSLYSQVPAVIVSATQNRCITGSQGGFEGLEPFGRILPPLGPGGGRPPPGQRETERTSPPGGNAVAQAATQACQRLEQM